MTNSFTDTASDTSEMRGFGQSAQILTPALYMVATPIGNLRDITLRALDVLRACDAIYAEDTRVIQKLLQAYGIEKKTVRCDAHQETERANEIIEAVRQGYKIVFVSDAGTPAISDPGAGLVAACVAANINVIPISGACAVTTAICASGIENNSFLFLGFLPNRSAARRAVLQAQHATPATLVLYEAPQRVAELLQDIEVVLGSRQIVIARELTKKFERFYRGTVSELLPFAHEDNFKGEVVVLIEGATSHTQEAITESDLLLQLQQAMRAHSLKEAVAMVTAQTGLPRKTIYALALQVSRDTGE